MNFETSADPSLRTLSRLLGTSPAGVLMVWYSSWVTKAASEHHGVHWLGWEHRNLLHICYFCPACFLRSCNQQTVWRNWQIQHRTQHDFWRQPSNSNAINSHRCKTQLFPSDSCQFLCLEKHVFLTWTQNFFSALNRHRLFFGVFCFSVLHNKSKRQWFFCIADVELSENGTYKCELRSRDSILSSVKHKLTVLGKRLMNPWKCTEKTAHQKTQPLLFREIKVFVFHRSVS